MAVKAKELHYAIELGPDGEVVSEDRSPEHLLLAALAGCALESLRYSAGRADIAVAATGGSARALVTRRESDGRYAVVRIDLTLDVALDPKPQRGNLTDLLAKAERGCFIGASLEANPTYRWNVS